MASASATVAPATTAAATAVTATTASATVAATATTVTAAATPAAATTTATRRPCLTRPGFVHGQRTTFDGLPIELCNGSLSIRLRTHRDKGEATRLAGEFVLHERNFRDRSGLRKKLLQFVFRRIEGKIAYV